MSTTAATIPRHSAPAPTQMPMMIGREKLEEEPAEEESIAPGKGGNGVVEVVEFAINTETELARPGGVDVAVAVAVVVVVVMAVMVVKVLVLLVVKVAVVAVGVGVPGIFATNVLAPTVVKVWT